MNYYFRFYQTRHSGFVIEFISEEDIKKLIEDEDNYDIFPCMLTIDSPHEHNFIYLGNINQMELTSWEINDIPFQYEKNKDLLEISKGKMKVGEIIFFP